MKKRLIIISLIFIISPFNLYAFNLFDDFNIQYLKGNSEYFSRSHNNIYDKTISDYQSLRIIYKNIGISRSLNQLENTNTKTDYKANASMEIFDLLLYIPLDELSLTLSKNIFVQGTGNNNYGVMEFKEAQEWRWVISSYIISYKIKFFTISIGHIENDYIFTKKCEYGPCEDEEYFHNKTYLLLYGLSF